MNNAKYFSITYDMSKLSDDEQKAVIAEASSLFRSQKAVCAGWESGDNGWIDPKDHFPDRDVILTHHADGSIRVTDLLGAEYEHKITHWQPLPQPPKGVMR